MSESCLILDQFNFVGRLMYNIIEKNNGIQSEIS